MKGMEHTMSLALILNMNKFEMDIIETLITKQIKKNNGRV